MAKVAPLVLTSTGVRRATSGDTTPPDITQAMVVCDWGTVAAGGQISPGRSQGTWQRFQVASAMTVTDISGWPAAGIGADCVFEVINGGSAAVTWPSDWLWRQTDGTYGASPPRALQTAGKDILVVITSDGGATQRVLM